ncbi:serine/threonine-protein kinase-like protein CCR4 [Lotus japonicus]|uniref:serine/threonine-protein kinase-like protein CCR4 n=1 Tax=Lotus japonicus TaxID=34305 RepID=UPI0025840ECE|nr:serine/threonine-protein kinase-like protein CCR4 [Lotus japonicus]
MAFLLNSSFCYLFISLCFLSSLPIINTLSTVSISETSNQIFICALQQPNQQGQSNLNCTSFPPGIGLQVNPNVSYSQIVGGNGFLCASRPSSSSSSTSIMGCWRFSANASNVPFKRIYHGPVIEDIDSGNSHVCGLVRGLGLECWQWPGFNSTSSMSRNMSRIAVGENFVCGLSETGSVTCMGSNTNVVGHEPVPGRNYSLLAAGFRHACAISGDGSLDCWGDMEGQKPQGRFISLALGENRSCALGYDGLVSCWGSNNFSMPQRLKGTFFDAIVAKRSVFCGVVTSNYSLICWGSEIFESNTKVFVNVLPGPCRNQCPCGPLSDSAKLCDPPAIICKPCQPAVESSFPLEPPQSPWTPPPLPTEPSAESGWSSKMVAFLVIGCVGCSALLLALVFIIHRYCKGKVCRVHDSGRLDDPPEAPAAVPAVLEKRLSHVISMGNGGTHLEEFSMQVLLQATNNFSEENKIGSGSFGFVYHATLEDGKEVAVKRAEITPQASPSNAVLGGGTKRQEDKDNAFVNELESLSRLHHKNLVRLLGFYEDNSERILVYEYMSNGSLNDHLHKLQTSSLIMSWGGRIKVALDAARGVEYLHQYATPPIIHRDIKSSNILLDAKWTAKVSDFGLSLMGPDSEDEESHLSLLAAGTVGYMDPEYYRLHHLTTKSDVYSFGVVLLELLSGLRAIHRNENGVPRNVVDFMVPFILQDEIHRVLDPRVPPPTPFQIEAVAFVGYLASDCVRLEGRDRPTMTHIVNSLETALAACLAQPTLSRSSTDSSDEFPFPLRRELPTREF